MPSKSLETEQAVREHLAALLRSNAFAHVDRLKRFLRYVVEETIAGRAENLKEYSIGVEVFDRETSFDPRTDPIVRVQARRLRARLGRYYDDEGRSDEFRIELPKGSYAPQFQRHSAVQPKRSLSAVLADRNTIAAQSFADLSPSGELGYFCGGLNDEIVNALTKVPQLRVVANAVERTAGPAQAATIISGSVRKSGSDLRITVQLMDT